MEPRLKEIILKEINPSLKEMFGYKNQYMGPKIEKIVLNMGLGLDGNDSKIVKSCQDDLASITGQKPVITKFRKSIANFKLREGMPIGCKVTLRGQMMYDFFEKLIKISLPRTRDFRGYSDKSFDGRGNYTLGIKEHIIFPEIDFDKIDKIKGLDICITTSAKNNEEAMELFKQFNFPFKWYGKIINDREREKKRKA